jgi:serine/threonine protein phosphatase PrpC
MAEKKLMLEMAARTDAGRERAINEDNFLGTANYRNADWFLPAESYPDAGSIMVVADGMGGLNAGEVASRITVDSIKEYLQQYDKVPATDDAVRNMLSKAISYAHKKVVTHSAGHEETHGMGSTVIIGLIAHRKIHFCWSGDSRGYIFRLGQLRQATKDHSYVQSLVDEGKLTAEQAFLHPESNVILQSIGDPDKAPEPDYVAVPLNDNDILILCSDGVNGMLQDVEIQALLSANAGLLPQCAEKIVEAANQAGGIDNITVVLSRVVSGAGAPKPLDPAGAATLDPFAQATIKGKKRRTKPRWIIILVLALLLTMGFLVAPMISRRETDLPSKHPGADTSALVRQKKPVDSPQQKSRSDTSPPPKKRSASPKPQKTVPDSIRLTPISPDKDNNP